MTQSNRDIAWSLLDQCIELYTPEAQQGLSNLHEALQDPNEKVSKIQTKQEKDSLIDGYKEKYLELFASISELFIFLSGNFTLDELTEDEKTEFIAEIKGLMHGEIKREDVSDRAFPIVIANAAMRVYKIPIHLSSHWRTWAEPYTYYIMAS